LVAVTATFRLLYVFVVIEHGRRRLAHVGVTNHPTADWTLQQLREVVGDEGAHRYLLHERDSIFARYLDNSIRALGLKVLRTPFRSPQANSIGGRVIGTIRRECLDWMIPVTEAHLRATLREWVRHYNTGRPHKSLGPGVPDPEGGFGDSEFRIPPSIGGGCGRDHEIGVGRTPSRVFTSAGRRLIAMVSK
jgi:transposase InsO family protein